jgi:hypothetical protein
VARLVFALLTVAGLAQILHAADVADAPSPITVTSPLEYQETDYSIANWDVSLTTQTAPFKNEPAAAGKIIRGSLNLGGDASNAVSFVWQRDAGKLFLDLNRNQDLTDDAAGVFSTQLSKPVNYQTFTSVRLPLATTQGRCRMLADLDFYEYGTQLDCNLSVRCFWQGKVTLQGQEWQVGVIPAICFGKNGRQGVSFENGQLLLRPWEKRNQAFDIYNGSLATVSFNQKLFIGGHAYQLDWVTGAQNSEVEPAIQFTEQSVALGELQITGKYIQRLVLPGGPYLVVLDHPAATVKVPVGSYSQPNVRLEQGGMAAYLVSSRQPTGPRISVDDKTPAVLAIGGPLTNSVLASRHGQDLRMDYRLIGAGGMTYRMANQDHSHPPEFAVSKGDKKIASGKFEFG